MKSFMRQTKGGLKKLINSFGVARDSFRRADDLFSALGTLEIQSEGANPSR